MILSGDIDLRCAERMNDYDDGGGEMSAVTVVDGQLHQVFPPISSSDRITGKTSLRELYLHIDTATDDTYYGANMIVGVPPNDPNTSILLFSGVRSGGEHTDAKNYIESYVGIGSRSQMHPVGNHSIGSSIVAVFQTPGKKFPDINDIYYMSIETGVGAGTTQAIKIKSVDVQYNVEFPYDEGGKTLVMLADVIIITITQPLEYNFPGADPTPKKLGATWVRKSTFKDSSKYVGISALTDLVTSGDTQLSVDTVWGNIIPVMVSETTVLDKPLANTTAILTYGEYTVEATEIAHSHATPVTIASNGLIYNLLARPYPAPGTMVVSYRAGGKWYELQDDGTGQIKGDSSAYGSGYLLPQTGSATVTLGAIPDIGSSVIWQWGSKVHYTDRTTSEVTKPIINYSVGEPIKPGTLVLTWLEGNVEKTASANSFGIITGDCIGGACAHSTGQFYIELAIYPDNGTLLGIEYDTEVRIIENLTGLVEVGGLITMTATQHPITTGSVEVRIAVKTTDSYTGVPPLTLTQIPYQLSPPAPVATTTFGVQRIIFLDNGDGTIGSTANEGDIDYNTGEITVKIADSASYSAYSQGNEWSTSSDCSFEDGKAYLSYVLQSGTPTNRDKTAAIPSPQFKFGGDLITDSILPGGLIFQWNGREYRDNGSATLFSKAIPWGTGEGAIESGSVDYLNRTATVTEYASGSGDVTTKLCVTRYGKWLATEIYGRTPGSPLKPGSTLFRVVQAGGDELVVTTDASGIIDETLVQGTIDQNMGILSVSFGSMQPSNPPGGPDEWVPIQVAPDTLKFNTVLLTSIPLSALDIGLNPVALPQDGRVQILRSGYRIVIHNNDTLTLPNPAIPGSQHNVGRTRISRVRLLDSTASYLDGNGNEVPGPKRVPDDRIDTNYTDLDAGIIALTNPLDLTGYTQPLKIEHTIEDGSLVLNADISGLIDIYPPVTHNYPAGSFISGQVFMGDMSARYSNLFAQTSWTGVWSDERIGNNTTGQYNDIYYPFELLNSGVIEERWRITFTSSTEFIVVGERLGQITTGDTSTDLQPMNVAGGYLFKISNNGWGSGWATGNTVRFNTYGPKPFWIARTVLPSQGVNEPDTIRLIARGDTV